MTSDPLGALFYTFETGRLEYANGDKTLFVNAEISDFLENNTACCQWFKTKVDKRIEECKSGKELSFQRVNLLVWYY